MCMVGADAQADDDKPKTPAAERVQKAMPGLP
jgi:hypothetical protein